MSEENRQITPEYEYMNRKTLMKGGLLLAAGYLTYRFFPSVGLDGRGSNDGLTEEKYALHYNNYYEFSTDKEAVADLAKGFRMDPWDLEISGLVDHPYHLTINSIRKSKTVDRIYRLRCVEGWSMVLPWKGIRLREILEQARPKPDAKYVKFTTVSRPTEMPGQKDIWYDWPYVEGLRLDEAMNDLTLLATGLYGKPLRPQNGGPIRLVVPWKYGFKSIKSIVKIEVVSEMPESFWMKANSTEYGFYANVNPDVPHPRWSQATERRIGEFGRIRTRPFNGYEKEVAHLYEGMDLKKWF